ncbi:MAG: stage III sporulation protein AF, partial [Clostridia bacterium]|nr:stage III sporulation protein AF [Clostridia bacterium]
RRQRQMCIRDRFAPDGSLNKYVKLVCGLAMTVIIAVPVIQFLKGGFKMETLAWNEYTKLSEGELKRRIERVEKEDSKQMLEVYRQSLIEDIKTRFAGESEFMVTSVDAVLYEDPNSESFGMIRALYIVMEPQKGNFNKTLGAGTLSNIKKELSSVFSVDEQGIIIDTSTFSGGG